MASVPFISLAELKEHVEVNPAATQFDARLRGVIAAASSMIESACRQSFARTVRTEYHASRAAADVRYALHGDSEDSRYVTARPYTLALGASPVDASAPFSVHYDAAHAFGDDRLVEPRFYALDPATGTVTLHLATAYAPRAIRIVYTAGYAVGEDGTLSAALPDDLKQAALWQALYLWNKTKANAIGLDRPSAEGGTASAKFVAHGGLVPEALALCLPYRRLLTGAG
ncbi:hypothetical protein [Azospirillum argentinense]|uniref:hypothetical protein n=1 Tax=Azospirillum argentinense TaxID=2970906 RepID=UPI0032DF65C0